MNQKISFKERRWQAQEGELALLVGASDLDGLVSTTIVVPQGSRGFVLSSNGEPTRYDEGVSIVLSTLAGAITGSGSAEALIVRSAGVPLSFSFENALSAIGISYNVYCTVSVRVDTGGLNAFRKQFCSARGVVGCDALRCFLAEKLKGATLREVLKRNEPDLECEEIQREVGAAIVPNAVTAGLSIQVDSMGIVNPCLSKAHEENAVDKINAKTRIRRQKEYEEATNGPGGAIYDRIKEATSKEQIAAILTFDFVQRVAAGQMDEAQCNRLVQFFWGTSHPGANHASSLDVEDWQALVSIQQGQSQSVGVNFLGPGGVPIVRATAGDPYWLRIVSPNPGCLHLYASDDSKKVLQLAPTLSRNPCRIDRPLVFPGDVLGLGQRIEFGGAGTDRVLAVVHADPKSGPGPMTSPLREEFDRATLNHWLEKWIQSGNVCFGYCEIPVEARARRT